MAKWARETSTYANQVGDEFKASLKAVAETFANHERVDSVSVKHVDESFAALARLGLHSKRWWQRSDTWTACGAFLFGIAFSVPDACSSLCSLIGLDANASKVASVSLMVILMGFGLGIYFWARYHGSLPKKRGAT